MRKLDRLVKGALLEMVPEPDPALKPGPNEITVVISDGKDWTKYTPQTEFPYIQRIYTLYGAADKVERKYRAALNRVGRFRMDGSTLTLSSINFGGLKSQPEDTQTRQAFSVTNGTILGPQVS